MVSSNLYEPTHGSRMVAIQFHAYRGTSIGFFEFVKNENLALMLELGD
jgi:hypothetical protein